MNRTRTFREGNAQTSDTPSSTSPQASPKQHAFIQSLLAEREMPESQREAARAQLEGLSKADATRWISRLLELPKAQKTEAPKSNTPDVPAGRYAVTGVDGTTDFYKVDRPEKGKWAGYTFVKLIVGGGFAGSFDECVRIGRDQSVRILQKIEEAGPREAAIRYGKEIGRCSCCGRTLTDPESIETGIGPICAGKAGW